MHVVVRAAGAAPSVRTTRAVGVRLARENAKVWRDVHPFPRGPMQQNEDSSAPAPSEGSPSLNLVGIGASAGGITALRSFFEAIPEETGIAFVVVMHLSPDRESQLAEVLQPFVKMPVRQVRARTPLEPDHVYVIPPDRAIEVTNGHLQLTEFEEPRGRRSPIDTFFRTVAEVHPDGVGVLLSGSGTDGVAGLKAIKERGGIIMAQSPEEADYDTMPRSAVATGLVDFVLPARELGQRVVGLRAHGVPWSAPSAVGLEAGDTHALRAILTQLRTRTGHDFSGYKRSTVLRRIGRRMQVTSSLTLAEYLARLQHDTTEARALLKDLLISVTGFFRDPEAFEALETAVIPALFEAAAESGEVRAWVAGCATGEEAYSIAMLLAEQADRMQSPLRIQVFATDLDEDAIEFARVGLYPDAVAADVSEERALRFLTREGAYVRVKKELRERILFSPHDLLRDPPFSRLGLVACRNLLIYLEKGLQDRVLELFRYALRTDGYLFLGESESAPEGAGFRSMDRQHRIYQRARRTGSDRRHLPELPLHGRTHLGDRVWPRAATGAQAAADGELHRQALEAHAPPSVLVDADHIIIHVSETANRYLQFTAGTPSANVLKAARPELRIDLRSALFQALDQATPALTRTVPMDIEGEPVRVQMHVAPARLPGESPLALVTFLESGPAEEAEPKNEGGTAAGRLEDTEAELATTRTRLQEMIESSERRQEELKASNEELQSINEEYKSTLEELETSKEELQSANEELKTVNDELKVRLEELGRTNDDLSNLMAATEIPTLFLDRQLRIQRFTPALRQLFNVLPVDQGRPLEHVTHRMQYPELRADCQRVLDSLQPLEREVGNGGGHAWLARLTPYRTSGDEIRGVVATFTDVTHLREAQRHVRESAERFRALIEATAEIVWTTAPDGSVVEDSPSWRAFTGQTLEEWLGCGWLAAVHPDDRAETEAAWRHAVETATPMDHEFRLRKAATGEWRFMVVRAVPVLAPDGSVREWVGMDSDITQRKESEAALRHARHAAEQAAEAKSQFLATMSHELRTPLTAVIGISDVLESEPLTPRQKEHLRHVKSSAWHLVSIIDEVLTFTRLEAGRAVVRRAPVDVAAIARDVASMLEISARQKGLALELVGADSATVAVSDGGKLRLILTNLVGNAVKFTDSGRVTLELKPSDEWMDIDIRDTGPGIPEAEVTAVFDPFFQIDSSATREKGGSGLGLAVSRRLARLLGGDVTLTPNSGGGAVFSLRVPRGRPIPPAAEMPPTAGGAKAPAAEKPTAGDAANAAAAAESPASGDGAKAAPPAEPAIGDPSGGDAPAAEPAEP